MITKIKHLAILVVFLILLGCNSRKEVVLPFYNSGYTSSRLQPIMLSDASFALRIWINNGTSMERVISLSKTEGFGDEGYLDEMNIGTKTAKSLRYHRRVSLMPKSGLISFRKKIDSIGLVDYESQMENDLQIALHQPFSFYVVELKEGDKYKAFKFYTPFPVTEKTKSKYDMLEDLFFSEFKYAFK